MTQAIRKFANTEESRDALAKDIGTLAAASAFSEIMSPTYAIRRLRGLDNTWFMAQRQRDGSVWVAGPYFPKADGFFNDREAEVNASLSFVAERSGLTVLTAPSHWTRPDDVIAAAVEMPPDSEMYVFSNGPEEVPQELGEE
jgi:hypothetical protein